MVCIGTTLCNSDNLIVLLSLQFTMATTQVLIIAFHAPPKNTSAVNRVQCLLDHLPKMNYKPTIITPERDAPVGEEYSENIVQTPYPGDVDNILRQKLPFLDEEYAPEESPHIVTKSETDYGFLKQLSKGSINNAKSLLMDTIAYPDPQRFWADTAIQQGRTLLAEGKFDLLLSTAPPMTDHLIANQLAGEFQVPWVADFQDLWTQYHYNRYNPIRDCFESRLQKRVIDDASHLTAATDPFSEALQSFHGKPSRTIHVGFKRMDTRPVTDEFTITYTGGLSDGRRDPTKLFEAVEQLESRPDVNPTNIIIQFIGVQSPWLTTLIEQYDLDSTIKQTKWLPNAEILKEQQQSQLLLSIQWDHPQERMVCPGKIFEYLAAQRPIIAYGGPTDGVVSSILAETNTGVKLDSTQDIVEHLERRYHEYEAEGEVVYHGDIEEINEYHHKKMASKFVNVFETVRS